MPTIRQAFVFRLYPTTKPQTTLDTALHLCPDVYNAALYERREAYRVQHKSLSYR